jgi:cyclohexyl-isocyanide hydratase
MTAPPLKIGFVVFPELTQLDFSGPYEVLWRLPGAQCHLVAHARGAIPAVGGLTFFADTPFSDCPQLDILCVPGGGNGHLNAMQDDLLLDFLRKQAEGCRYVTAVCTGSMVLAAAGLLRGYRATTHWMSLERLKAFGAIPVAARVVIDRNRMTGGGVTAGIDFGLTLAAEIAGPDFARRIQLQIEYAPAPPFDSGTPDCADPRLVTQLRTGTEYAQRMAQVDDMVLARSKGKAP